MHPFDPGNDRTSRRRNPTSAPPGEIESWERLPAPFVERPCAVGAAGAPFEELSDFGVGLEALELL